MSEAQSESACEHEPGPAIAGFVEAMTEGAALGWVWSPGREERVGVELRLNGEAVGRGVADVLREDLARSGIGDGRHAFNLPIPEAVRARANELRVFALCERGAIALEAPPSPDPMLARFGQLQRGIDMLIGSQRLMHRNLQAALVQSPAASGASLAEIAAAQGQLQESIETFEVLAVRLERALARDETPDSAAPHRALPLVAGFCAVTFVISCCALARAMLG